MTLRLQVILKPCPWCRRTPDIHMPIDEETWCWKIKCCNRSCLMQPESPHVSIRKSAKIFYMGFYWKVAELADKWNRNNPFNAFDAKQIDLTAIAPKNGDWEEFQKEFPAYKNLIAGAYNTD